jgi:hypothetical protein
MSFFITKTPAYSPKKDAEIDWDNFRGGLDTLLRPRELEKNELSQADNLMLTGSGVPTKRWGTAKYHLAGATGSVRGMEGFYKTMSDPELIVVTDNGLATKKSGASYTVITGASWPSGTKVEMSQLNDNLYLVSEDRELTRYDGINLTSFPTVAPPTGLYATQLSGASGTNSYSYRVASVTDVGESLACDNYVVTSQPQDLDDGPIRVIWTAPSTASGVLKGSNIYGRGEGDERFLGSVDGSSTTFIDDNSVTPAEFTYPQTADTTGGVKAAYIRRFQDRFVYGGFKDDPSKVIISGRVPLHERNDISYGGNYIRIEPDSGDSVTGIEIFENKIIVFKERSIWKVTLSTLELGNYWVTIPEATLITRSHGCVSDRTICHVENDMFFLSRKGVYILGYEPNILNVLRTNEISVKIRPFFTGLTISQLQDACAVYSDSKYVLSFPSYGRSIIFDRERTAWMGPWTYDATVYNTYFDENNNDILLYGKYGSPQVNRLGSIYSEDEGVAIKTTLRTKLEDFGDWSIFKNLKDVFLNFRNVVGSANANIRLEERDGNTITAKSFSIQTQSSNAGWGADLWGNTLFGDSEESGGGSDSNDLVKWAMMNKAARTIQIEINTTNRSDTYELLGIRMRAKPISKGYNPSSWRV